MFKAILLMESLFQGDSSYGKSLPRRFVLGNEFAREIRLRNGSCKEISLRKKILPRLRV
jgi:hypothetical protein